VQLRDARRRLESGRLVNKKCDQTEKRREIIEAMRAKLLMSPSGMVEIPRLQAK